MLFNSQLFLFAFLPVTLAVFFWLKDKGNFLKEAFPSSCFRKISPSPVRLIPVPIHNFKEYVVRKVKIFAKFRKNSAKAKGGHAP